MCRQLDCLYARIAYWLALYIQTTNMQTIQPHSNCRVIPCISRPPRNSDATPFRNTLNVGYPDMPKRCAMLPYAVASSYRRDYCEGILIHTYIHTYIHIYIRTYIHTYIHHNKYSQHNTYIYSIYCMHVA